MTLAKQKILGWHWYLNPVASKYEVSRIQMLPLNKVPAAQCDGKTLRCYASTPMIVFT